MWLRHRIFRYRGAWRFVHALRHLGAGSEIIFGSNAQLTPNFVQDSWIHDHTHCEDDAQCTEHTDGIGMVDTGGSSTYDTVNHNNKRVPVQHESQNKAIAMSQ